MAKFPIDAPKSKVIKTLEKLGFKIVREREHIAMIRENENGTTTPLTLPNHKKLKHLHSEVFVLRLTFLGKIFYHFIMNKNEITLISSHHKSARTSQKTIAPLTKSTFIHRCDRTLSIISNLIIDES